MPEFDFLRNASVEVRADSAENGSPIANIIVNGEFTHQFSPISRVSKALELAAPETLADQLSGGHYLFVGDQLVDFRNGRYNGFVHTDDALHRLNQVLGIQVSDGSQRLVGVHNNLFTTEVVLGKMWSDNGITVAEYKEGGNFTSEVHFGWNPFVQHVNSSFMLVRLICTNGMKGLTSFLNTRIPLVNRWEEHLDIANTQIQNKVNSMMPVRFRQMGAERATVAEVLTVANHATTRLENNSNLSVAETSRLNNIVTIAHPVKHLSSVYRSKVFEDNRLAAQMPAHLSAFDAYNMITELRSHTTEHARSTMNAMDLIANRLVFNRKDMTQQASRFMLPQDSAFSNPEQAFFGTGILTD